MPSFNLLDECWIPCRLPDGRLEEMGLRDTLARAHVIVAIDDPAPTVTVALHRLLLAILHRVFGPRSIEAWASLRDSGAWDMAALDAYFARWRDRFDLLHPERPFYQTPGLDVARGTPATKLTPERLSPGNAVTLFDHTLDEALTLAQAARALVAHHAFTVGGLVTPEGKEHRSADAGPLAKAAVMLVKGATLFETLLFNLLLYDGEEEPFPCTAADQPAWERATPPRAGDRVPVGYLDWLTWQSRRTLLHPELDERGQMVVRRAVIMKGEQLPDGAHRHDYETMLAFGRNEKPKPGDDPWPVVAPREDRAIWRDSLTLVQAGRRTRPRTLDWLARLGAEGVIDDRWLVPLDVHGLLTDQARVVLWRHERLPLPLAYLEEKELQDRLAAALALAEEVARVVDQSSEMLARLLLAPTADQPGARQPDRQAVGQLKQSLGGERAYWSRLEGPFTTFLIDQAADRRPEGGYGHAALGAWATALRAAARAAFDEAASGLDGSGRSLKALAVAERRFLGELSKAMQPVVQALQEGEA
jgi:CRISPR system Cascade subunit CasA